MCFAANNILLMRFGDRMIKQLLNSLFAKYQCLADDFIDPLVTEKLRYFAQPRPIIVYLRDKPCNLELAFLVLFHIERKNHSDISCSFRQHSRRYRSSNLLDKE